MVSSDSKRETHEEFMARMSRSAKRDVEIKMLKGSKATKIQVGGNHYKDFKIMPIEYISKNNLDFLEGNIVKYVSRHRNKNGAEDIKKIIHYAELILELEYGEN
tara:strand:- start:180 stop:491 length:312 start_codon:yes stop_codon:yes gene_type:complete